jgi:hypothetical protein
MWRKQRSMVDWLRQVLAQLGPLLTRATLQPVPALVSKKQAFPTITRLAQSERRD